MISELGDRIMCKTSINIRVRFLYKKILRHKFRISLHRNVCTYQHKKLLIFICILLLKLGQQMTYFGLTTVSVQLSV
jgi:hypothetical protein